MNLRIAAVVLAFLTPLSLFAAPADGASSQFSLSEPTLIPGATLPPGAYSIKIVDHLQDRVLLHIDGNGGTSHALFIAVPAKIAGRGAHSGKILWQSAANGKTAMRGFDFGQSTLEFVYPKDDAVALAKANGTPVLAVDPASEGKAPQLTRLSNDDMQTVTLWTLTPERVGGSTADTTISANKYQAKPANGSTQQVARAENRPPVTKVLPHTGSNLPLILLGGILAALGAGWLRVRRSSATAA